MPLNKSRGNMFDFVTHTHTHLKGMCPHQCTYCSIQAMQRRFGSSMPYSGPIRFDEAKLLDSYGCGRTIFIENCNDMFANGIPGWMQLKILDHCEEYPENRYVFSTKNPTGLFCINWDEYSFEPIIGCTIETNRGGEWSYAPPPRARAFAMGRFKSAFPHIETFVTIEPIMMFDLVEFVDVICEARPDFVNIGADSKKSGLPEPSWKQVNVFAAELKRNGIDVRKKHNIERLNTKH